MKKRFLLLSFLTFLVINVFAQTVYITKTGEKYHKENCRYLSKSKIAIDLSDVIARGYGACSVCKPPTKATSKSDTKSEPQITSAEKVNPSTENLKQSSQSASVQCSATTKAGTRCKRLTKSQNGKCWQHGGN